MTELLNAGNQVLQVVPLPPPLQAARMLGNTQNQEAARKGLNIGQAIIFGVAATISLVIAIGLLVAAGMSNTPHMQDGRWYGGWSVLVLAFIPLSILTGYTIYRNESCRGDVVGALASNAPGKLGKAAQLYQQL